MKLFGYGFGRQPTERDRLIEQLEIKTLQAESKLLQRAQESLDLSSNYVDPSERYRDDGQIWEPLGSGAGQANDRSNFRSEAELTAARNSCRYLARNNPFAICGHENRISYLVGGGHTYTPVALKGEDVPEDWLKETKGILDEFYDESDWCSRQKETVRRFDRDGECFRRIFDIGDAIKVRFVEPWQVTQPESRKGAEHAFGIHTGPDDEETRIGYWVSLSDKPNDIEEVPAEEIQHIRANVDFNARRGVPTFWPARNLLWSSIDTLLNIGATAKIQTSIAVIRRHQGGNKSGLESLRASSADFTRSNPVSGNTEYTKINRPGRIVDASANTEYDFPAAGIDVNRYGLGVQAMLRAVSAMVVMPEFMFTADASNANYSSTMIAEGPSVKNFQRLQAELSAYDVAVMWLVLEKAVSTGRLSGEYINQIDIQVGMPALVNRDKLQESQVDEILANAGILSPQTRAARADLEYEQEQSNITQAAAGLMPDATELQPQLGPDGLPLPVDTQPAPGVPVAGVDGGSLVTDTILNGTQLTAATAIVVAVAGGTMPRDAGLGQMMVLFNLSADQANAVMGSAGTGVATKPNVNPADATAQQTTASVVSPAATEQPAFEGLDLANVQAREKAWRGYPL